MKKINLKKTAVIAMAAVTVISAMSISAFSAEDNQPANPAVSENKTEALINPWLGMERYGDDNIYGTYGGCISVFGNGTAVTKEDFQIPEGKKYLKVKFNNYSVNNSKVLLQKIKPDSGEIIKEISLMDVAVNSAKVSDAINLEDNFSPYAGTYRIAVSQTSGYVSEGSVKGSLIAVRGSDVSSLDNLFGSVSKMTDNLVANTNTFAMRYNYRGDELDTTFAVYPEERLSRYTSGTTQRQDGSEYELPAFYDDMMAAFFGSFDLQTGEVNILVNGQPSQHGNKCVLQNGVTLVPVSVFKELGCSLEFDESLYLTTISNGTTTLEILPILLGMRKNGADGYYAPLTPVARFVDDEVYVPVRIVAEELNVQIDWDAQTNTVILNSNI